MRFQLLLHSHFFAFVTILLASCHLIFNVAAAPVTRVDSTHALVKREVISWDSAMEETIQQALPRMNAVLDLLRVVGMEERSKKAFLYWHFKAVKTGGSKQIYLFKDTKGTRVGIAYPKLCDMVWLSRTRPPNTKEGIRALLNGFLPRETLEIVLLMIERTKGPSGSWLDGFRRYFAGPLSKNIQHYDHYYVLGYPGGGNAQAGPSNQHGHGPSSSQAQSSNARSHAATNTMQGGSHSSSVNPTVGYPVPGVVRTSHGHSQQGGVQSHHGYPQPHGIQGHPNAPPPQINQHTPTSSTQPQIMSWSAMTPQEYQRAVQKGKKSSSLSNWNRQN
ncbi:hypothetical protein C8Q75DRAFT_572912 [Abortiporus biennis]|nr:hypothetical protein C8Q75DRAFT_572912 [Abortiporus biennis]